MATLEVRHLRKSFGKIQALKDVQFDLEPGIVGLLGNNGAGKSTLLKILVTLIDPDQGEVRFQGRGIREEGFWYRQKLGYMPQQQSLYRGMTVQDFLSYSASLKGLHGHAISKRILELLQKLNLEEQRRSRLEALSGGMRQRVLIAQALLNDPAILILDEPTAGLDPVERRNFREVLVSFSADRIIILATHLVSDIEYIADHLIFLKQGSLRAAGSQEILCKRTPSFESVLPLRELRARYPDLKLVNRSPNGSHVLTRFISRYARETHWVSKVRSGLEDVYMDLLSGE